MLSQSSLRDSSKIPLLLLLFVSKNAFKILRIRNTDGPDKNNKCLYKTSFEICFLFFLVSINIFDVIIPLTLHFCALMIYTKILLFLGLA